MLSLIKLALNKSKHSSMLFRKLHRWTTEMPTSLFTYHTCSLALLGLWGSCNRRKPCFSLSATLKDDSSIDWDKTQTFPKDVMMISSVESLVFIDTSLERVWDRRQSHSFSSCCEDEVMQPKTLEREITSNVDSTWTPACLTQNLVLKNSSNLDPILHSSTFKETSFSNSPQGLI